MLSRIIVIFFLTILLAACSGYDTNQANNWWSENKKTAKKIIDILNDSKEIVRVDLDLSDDYVVNAYSFSKKTWSNYRLLVALARDTGLENISVDYQSESNRVIRSVSMTISASGLSTDGCALSVVYYPNGELPKNVRIYVASIKPIEKSTEWFAVINGDKQYCITP